MARRPLDDWFIPGEGIHRDVITSNVQRYLGNDATVRPGDKTIDGKLVQGYWVKAYRTFTGAMIEDLKMYSRNYDQEQKKAGRRLEYEDTRTHRDSTGTYENARYTPPHSHDYYSSRPREYDREYDRGPPPPRQEPYPRSTYDGRPPHDPRPAYDYPPHGHSPHPAPPAGDPYGSMPGYQSGWAGRDPRDNRDTRDPRDYPAATYTGQHGYPPRGYEPVDPRYPPREDPRYRERDDQRYAPRDDPRRDEYRYSGRDEPRRDDPRYPPDSRASRDYAYPLDPRYPPPQDRYPDDPRYQPPPRQGSAPIGYGAPPQQQPGYPYLPPPGAMPLPPMQSPPIPMPHMAPPRSSYLIVSDPRLTSNSFTGSTIYDQWGRPVAMATPLPPTQAQEAYLPPPFAAQQSPGPPGPPPLAQDSKDPNSSRKRGAPGEDKSRQRPR